MKKPLDDLKALVQLLFLCVPYFYQEKIMQAVFDAARGIPEAKRKISIRATTRAGKSFIIAVMAIIYAVFFDNRRVGIMAPSNLKARPIMDYIALLLSSNPIFDDIVMVETSALTKLERLRKEVSKRRITFKNGSSIEFLSVNENKQGFGAMGFGFHFIIIEETSEISDASYAKIYRMLVESADAIILEIGNPWFLDHFYEHHSNPEWEKIHIHWEDCVRAGRMTREAVEDQKRNLTDLEFKVLFEANFPTEVEFAIFTEICIQNCVFYVPTSGPYSKILNGADVAQGGRDITVITVFGKINSEFFYLEHIEMDTRDPMQVTGVVAELAVKYGKDLSYITIDGIGPGSGIAPRLREQGYKANSFIAGVEARNSKLYYNKKTEVAFLLAQMMKDEKIRNIPKDSRHVLDLRSWTYEIRSDTKKKIVDPNKSPDHGDSLLMALSSEIYSIDTRFIGVTGHPNPIRESVMRARAKSKSPSLFRSR